MLHPQAPAHVARRAITPGAHWLRPAAAAPAPHRRGALRARAGGIATQPAVQELLSAITGTERGVTTSAEAKQRIMAAVEELKRAGQQQQTTKADLLVSWAAPRGEARS